MTDENKLFQFGEVKDGGTLSLKQAMGVSRKREREELDELLNAKRLELAKIESKIDNFINISKALWVDIVIDENGPIIQNRSPLKFQTRGNKRLIIELKENEMDEYSFEVL